MTIPASTGPTRCSRYSKEVTTPKFPPPPRTPQKRSACSVALAVRNWPSAVTMSTERRLSEARPYWRASQPQPPPRVTPAIPVVEMAPPVTAKPKAWVSRSNSPQVRPGSAPAVRCTGSTRTLFSRDRSSTMPPSHTALPATLWPPPRTATTDDKAGSPVNHGVPQRTGLTVALVAWTEQGAAQARLEVVHRCCCKHGISACCRGNAQVSPGFSPLLQSGLWRAVSQGLHRPPGVGGIGPGRRERGDPVAQVTQPNAACKCPILPRPERAPAQPAPPAPSASARGPR